MIVEILVICLLAKLKHYKLKYLFYSWTFYPVLAVQCFLVIVQFSAFFQTHELVRVTPYLEPLIIASFAFALFVHRLYKPAIIGSASIIFGTALNKLVIAQNGGRMPVFPSLSYITGYVTPESFSTDSLHVLGSVDTKLKFLTDYIDYGYSILSLGDIFIHLFVCVMLYSLIKTLNLHYGCQTQEKQKGVENSSD